MMKALVIDDEEHARLTLTNFLAKYTPRVELIGTADSVESGVEQIREHTPNLVLLDIQMVDGTGFDLLNQLPEQNFYLIFITAFDDHAIKAIKYEADGYIVKPIDPDELIAAVNRIQAKAKRDSALPQETFSKKLNDEQLVLSTADEYRVVQIQDIVRLKAESNYTWFYFASGEKVLVPRSLKEYEERLAHQFFRVHQSHLVNLSFVSRFVKREGGYLVMKDGTELEVARRRKEEFLRRLGVHRQS